MTATFTERVMREPFWRRAAACSEIVVKEWVDGSWQVRRGDVVYTLTVEGGLVLRGELVVVPVVTCEPPPPLPIDEEGYEFANPPLWAVHASGEVWEDPLEAARQMIAGTVLRDAPEAG